MTPKQASQLAKKTWGKEGWIAFRPDAPGTADRIAHPALRAKPPRCQVGNLYRMMGASGRCILGAGETFEEAFQRAGVKKAEI